MDAVEYLEKGLELIKKGWCQNAGARNKNGCSVSARSPEAVSYCMDGALYKTLNPYIDVDNKLTISLRGRLYINAILRSKNYLHSLITFNDTEGRTKEEVIDVFEKAIELAKNRSRRNISHHSV